MAAHFQQLQRQQLRISSLPVAQFKRSRPPYSCGRKLYKRPQGYCLRVVTSISCHSAPAIGVALALPQQKGDLALHARLGLRIDLRDVGAVVHVLFPSVDGLACAVCTVHLESDVVLNVGRRANLRDAGAVLHVYFPCVDGLVCGTGETCNGRMNEEQRTLRMPLTRS